MQDEPKKHTLFQICQSDKLNEIGSVGIFSLENPVTTEEAEEILRQLVVRPFSPFPGLEDEEDE